MKKKLNQLTAHQKLSILCGADFWHTQSLNGLLPQITVSDGPMGLRTVKQNAEGNDYVVPAVAYPSINVLANSWSRPTAYAVGCALADDCIERDVDVLLAPGVNIKRLPINGRNFEYFSEDPYLAGTLALEYVNGVQDNGVGVCVKHFLANNLEYDRFHQSSEVDERTLREIYYKPFEIVMQAKPVSVMCSYNRVNGVYASENSKGFNVLRNDYGFDGVIISDWEAVRDRTASAKAGLDIEMPFNQNNYDKLVSDFNCGKITVDEVDSCAERVLHFIYRVKQMRGGSNVKTTQAERIKVAKNAYAEGVVLLKNDGLLPLNKNANVSVGGCYAKPDCPDMLRGGGSAEVTRLDFSFDIPLQLQKRILGKVLYEGAFRYDGVCCQVQDTRNLLLNAELSEINVLCVGTGSMYEYEQGDRQTIRLPAVQEAAILQTAARNPNTVVIIFAGSAIDVSRWESSVAAIIYAGFPGDGGDEVICDILTGEINPSGKLSETFAVNYEDIPAANAYISSGVTRYHEGLDVGYRYFDTYGVAAKYPFGHGLSYSQFCYSNLSIKAEGGLNLTASFNLSNVSNVDGKETAQLYVRECAPLVYRPYKELKGYDKVLVKAGSTVNVQIKLDKSAFEHWSVATDSFRAEDGLYEIIIGASVDVPLLSAKIKINQGEIILLD